RGVPGKLEFKTWEGRCLPVPDGGFDHVVATFPLAQVQDPAALFREVRRVLRAEGDVYLLYSVAFDTDLRHALTQAGFAEFQELARSADQMAVLVHARAALPTVSATPAHLEVQAPAPRDDVDRGRPNRPASADRPRRIDQKIV